MLLIELEGVLLSLIIYSSFVVEDMCLLQFVQCWLHLRDCSGSESVITSLRPNSLVVLWILHSLEQECEQVVRFQLLELGSSWRTSNSMLQMAWMGIRVRGTDNLNNFESEEILWNQNQGMNSKWYLFGDKGSGKRSSWPRVGHQKKCQGESRSITQYTKIENFILHLQLRKCKWKEDHWKMGELSRLVKKRKKWLRRK